MREIVSSKGRTSKINVLVAFTRHRYQIAVGMPERIQIMADLYFACLAIFLHLLHREKHIESYNIVLNTPFRTDGCLKCHFANFSSSDVQGNDIAIFEERFGYFLDLLQSINVRRQ